MAASNPYVLWPWQVRPDAPVGGKARALADLSRAKLPIPPWFVVLPDAFTASLTAAERSALGRARTAQAMQEALATLSIAPGVQGALLPACAQLAPAGAKFAVRSSAPAEDSAAHSFAGQLESFVNVAADAVAEHVVAVWRSAFSSRMLAYRKEAGLLAVPEPPAVLVQVMVEGETSGVAFSADPVSGRRSIVVVSAVPGLGGGLVSGEATGDTWRVGPDQTIVERAIAPKDVMQLADASQPDGIRRVAVPPHLAGQPCLEDAAVVRVAQLAIAAERHFGRPQDIEWTFAGDSLYLLQSRPITGLEDKADPDGKRAIWDNSNIAESYSGITTPLTFSFARRAYEHVYRDFCRIMGVPERSIEENDAMFCCMLGLVRGRVYYNLLNWYRLVGILPGYRVNRRFMEQMMGVRASLADEVARSAVVERGTHLRDALRVAATLVGLLVAFAGIERRVGRFYRRLDASLGRDRPDLSRLRPDELVAYCRRLEQQLLKHWDAPIVNDFATMISHGLLRYLVRRWIGDAGGTLQNDLLGDAGMVSAEPARRVARMAALAARHPQLVAALSQASGPAVPDIVAQYPEFSRALDEYISRFGERCMDELKLESATLHEDPAPLLRSVGSLAMAMRAGGERARIDGGAAVREHPQTIVDAALRAHPLRRLVFHRVLASARRRVRTREDLRFERTRVFGRARMIVQELGKRLAALGCLRAPQDVFFIEWDELLAYVEGRATTADLAGLVAVRQREFQAHAAAAAPADRFETRGIVYRGHDFTDPAAVTPTQGGEQLRGVGCCPGVRRGPVHVITNPRAANVRPGEILVAERTDPGWVMVFPAASGLLVERGSLLSHSAIVARELALPTIVAVPGLTRSLKDGDWIEMDGASGTIVRLPAPESAQ